MIGTSSKVALAFASAVLALSGQTFAGAASAAAGVPAADPADAVVDSGAFDAAVHAYQASYPQITVDQARAAALGQEERKAVVVAIIERRDDSFGGAWFDLPTGTLHVAATNASAVEQARQLAQGGGVRLATHLVKRSFTELQRRADALRGGEGALGQTAKGQVGIDVTTNEVTVALPASQLSTLAAPEGVRLVTDPGRKSRDDHGCTSRNACDQTIRAGVVVTRPGLEGTGCSAGFTARDINGSRLVYTAGHCAGESIFTKWSTGAEQIGNQGLFVNSGAVDAMPIYITNPWFTGDLGGEIYVQGGSFSMAVKGVANSLGFIVPGETVCLSANITDPTGANLCGTVGTTSDATKRGLVRVNGVDACGGDSGGGWYWVPASGRLYAYGIHQGSDPGCHGDTPDPDGQTSWFTAIPLAMTAVAPTYNVELR